MTVDVPFGDRFTGVVEAARSGDERAWRELYEELSGALRAYFVVRHVPDPDDLVGEVFLDVARNLATFDGDESGLRSWVFTIAHHRWVDAVRVGTRRAAEQPTDTFDLLADRRPDARSGGPTGEDDALVRLGVEELRELVDRLSPDQRDVILLRYLGDQSMEQIATTLGKNPNAVKALHLRALRSLRRIIAVTLLPALLTNLFR